MKHKTFIPPKLGQLDLLQYEITGSSITPFLFCDRLKRMASGYFNWKTKRKYRRYIRMTTSRSFLLKRWNLENSASV